MKTKRINELNELYSVPIGKPTKIKRNAFKSYLKTCFITSFHSCNQLYIINHLINYNINLKTITMKKIYLPLLKEQKKRGVYFSSTLSPYKFEALDTNRHEITHEQYQDNYKEAEAIEQRLKDDSFFNNSHFNFNIIRQ